VWHDSFTCVTWLMHVSHDLFVCVYTLIRVCVYRTRSRRDAIGGVWLISNGMLMVPTMLKLIWICGMTDSHAWHDSFACVTWFIRVYIAYWCRYAIGGVGFMSSSMFRVSTRLKLIHMCDLTHSHVRPDSFTWLIRVSVYILLIDAGTQYEGWG